MFDCVIKLLACQNRKPESTKICLKCLRYHFKKKKHSNWKWSVYDRFIYVSLLHFVFQLSINFYFAIVGFTTVLPVV